MGATAMGLLFAPSLQSKAKRRRLAARGGVGVVALQPAIKVKAVGTAVAQCLEDFSWFNYAVRPRPRGLGTGEEDDKCLRRRIACTQCGEEVEVVVVSRFSTFSCVVGDIFPCDPLARG
jgi:hypothetical protein